jgi:malonate transporter and related proteins
VRALLLPLASVYLGVAAGYAIGASRLIERAWQRLQPASKRSPLDLLNALLFLGLIPVLLFRSAAQVDLAQLPLSLLAAYFVPAVAVQLVLVQWHRRQARSKARHAEAAPESAPLRAFTATFGNTVQLGVPMATALFGAPGLALHLQIVAVHALILMTLATVQAEWFRSVHAGASAGSGSHLLAVALQSARAALIHPVVLPILAGLAFGALGGRLPGGVDAVLLGLGQTGVVLCLVAIGWTLAESPLGPALRGSIGTVVVKLLALPAAVGLFAAGLGLQGLSLWVLVMLAALPSGANALLFAQRYRVGEAQAAAAIAASTLGFALSAPLCLALLGWLAPGSRPG